VNSPKGYKKERDGLPTIEETKAKSCKVWERRDEEKA